MDVVTSICRLPDIDIHDDVDHNPPVTTSGSTAAVETPMCWVDAHVGCLLDLVRWALQSHT
jgi:hypothetical protein